MSRHTFVLSLLLLFTQINATTVPYKAFIATPIADMVGDPLMDDSYYKDIPISWGPAKEDQICCPRVHQGLFNEIVTVKEIKGEWALVELENTFWYIPNNPEKFNTVWVRIKQLVPFKELEKRSLSSYFIPRPIQAKRDALNTCYVVTLLMPYFDQQTKKTYSAGTRFICDEQKKYGYYTVHIFDKSEWQFKKTMIPETVCHVSKSKRKKERITDFVALLKTWVRQEGFVPHCWGGISLTQFYQRVGFSLHAKTINGKTVQYWQLTNVPKEKVWSGFDASGLVLRAAQICDIPYYFKNTTTAAQQLRALDMHESVEEGDLLWVPGGLFVISDIQNNLLIGSLGYQHGYGKVIELPINQIFEEIETIHDLINTYHNAQTLHMKNADGIVYRTIDKFKILKMSSVWQK